MHPSDRHTSNVRIQAALREFNILNSPIGGPSGLPPLKWNGTGLKWNGTETLPVPAEAILQIDPAAPARCKTLKPVVPKLVLQSDPTTGTPSAWKMKSQRASGPRTQGLDRLSETVDRASFIAALTDRTGEGRRTQSLFQRARFLEPLAGNERRPVSRSLPLVLMKSAREEPAVVRTGTQLLPQLERNGPW